MGLPATQEEGAVFDADGCVAGELCFLPLPEGLAVEQGLPFGGLGLGGGDCG